MIISFEGGSSRSHYMGVCFRRGFGPVVRQTTKWIKCIKINFEAVIKSVTYYGFKSYFNTTHLIILWSNVISFDINGNVSWVFLPWHAISLTTDFLQKGPKPVTVNYLTWKLKLCIDSVCICFIYWCIITQKRCLA
jgi:hypothetical protein